MDADSRDADKEGDSCFSLLAMIASDAVRLEVSFAILLSSTPLIESGAALVGSVVAGVGTREESGLDGCSGRVDAEPCGLVKSNTPF